MLPVTSFYLAILPFLLILSLVAVSLLLKLNNIPTSIFRLSSIAYALLPLILSLLYKTMVFFSFFLPLSNAATSSRVPFFPKSIVSLVFRTYHDHPLRGHFGVHRTLTCILSQFLWPRTPESLKNYIASCTKRVCHNIVCTKPDGDLRFLSVPFAVFQSVHMYF